MDTTEGTSINITEEEFKELQDLYLAAYAEGRDEFVFKNKTFYTPYAKYFIEYWASVFNKGGSK